MDLPTYIVGLSYIPIYFPWISHHFPRPPGYPGHIRHRSKALLDVEEFLSHLDSMLSHQQWIQMQSPALPQLVLHDPRRISKRGRMGPPVFPKKRGSNWENLGENDKKCIPADLKWRFRAIEPKFFLVLIFSMYT